MRKSVRNNKSILAAAHALEKVLQIPQQHVFAVVCQKEGEWADLESWAQISRGSDLFLKGLGRFDIEAEFTSWKETEGKLQAGLQFMRWLTLDDKKEYFRQDDLEPPPGHMYNSAMAIEYLTKYLDVELLTCPEFNLIDALAESIKPNRLLCDDSDVIESIHSNGPDWWFDDVVSFQVHSYFGKLCLNRKTKSYLHTILSADEECPARIHLLKYYHGWCKPHNLAALDEMSTVVDNMREGGSQSHFSGQMGGTACRLSSY